MKFTIAVNGACLLKVSARCGGVATMRNQHPLHTAGLGAGSRQPSLRHRQGSLQIRWVRLECASTAGATDSVPGWGAEILHASWFGQKKKEVQLTAYWFLLEP